MTPAPAVGRLIAALLGRFGPARVSDQSTPPEPTLHQRQCPHVRVSVPAAVSALFDVDFDADWQEQCLPERAAVTSVRLPTARVEMGGPAGGECLECRLALPGSHPAIIRARAHVLADDTTWPDGTWAP